MTRQIKLSLSKQKKKIFEIGFFFFFFFSALPYLGGFDGAMTEAKYSWFCRLPLITSATVLIV